MNQGVPVRKRMLQMVTRSNEKGGPKTALK